MEIAIAGYGIEGESNYRYYSSDPNNSVTIFDQKQPSHEVPGGAEVVIGQDVFGNLDGFDLVVRTAGLAPSKIKTDGKVWSATNEFFEKCPAQIIGVTGTKGKGTTASIIASILQAAGKKVWLIGNIGKAALDVLDDILPDDIVVYELSSFQLWDAKRSPHIAVVSLIESEHLDKHVDFDDYVKAKANIRLFQGDDDICVFHPTNKWSKYVSKVTELGKAIRFGVSDDGGVYYKDDVFYVKEHKICSKDTLQIPGKHNIDNACAALTVAKICDVSDEDIRTGLSSFKGLPHRIEFVKEVDGIKYYDDSYSSAVPATIAAMESFDQPEILIIGGVDRGGDFDELRDAIANKSNVKKVILIGETRHKLGEIFSNLHNVEVLQSDSNDMKMIVNTAKNAASSGDVVILTPGCASFDMFSDFNERGDIFKREVNAL